MKPLEAQAKELACIAIPSDASKAQMLHLIDALVREKDRECERLEQQNISLRKSFDEAMRNKGQEIQR